MSKNKDITVSEAWEILFNKYNIIEKVETDGYFDISSTEINKLREARLMAKFDHEKNLPRIFSDNNLAILPTSRGTYRISHFHLYHELEPESLEEEKRSIPSYIQTLNADDITSESAAINAAYISGIFSDFLEEKELVPTVSGRQKSGVFEYDVKTAVAPMKVRVNNAQIEIDAVLEGINSVAVIEAKCNLSDDFIIRQLYYPYRCLGSLVSKPVRPVFLTFSNGIYNLYEYAFLDPNDYNSIKLVKQKKYSINDDQITLFDIEDVLRNTAQIEEPDITFPQADDLKKIINLCERLKVKDISKRKVSSTFGFTMRQADYYTSAGRYLGLVETHRKDREVMVSLTKKGKKLSKMKYRERQLALCKLILEHAPFAETLQTYFDTGVMPSKDTIMKSMKRAKVKGPSDFSTFNRRAKTLESWINWIVGLITD